MSFSITLTQLMRDPDARGKGVKQFQSPKIKGYHKQRKDAHLFFMEKKTIKIENAEEGLLGISVDTGRSTLTTGSA